MRPVASFRSGLALLCLSMPAAGCGGAGAYGFAHEYEFVEGERAYAEGSVTLSYEEVQRARPEAQVRQAWFGVVTGAPVRQEDGTVRVPLSLRAHQERHLCQTSSSETCRVTVSARDLGSFTAVLSLRPDDRAGRLRLWTGSLVKVYGTATGETDASGGPVLRGEWYRHWPAHYFVTTAASGGMRR